MSNLCFLDTNLFTYADDASHPDKREAALEVIKNCLREQTAMVSLQVMHEYFVVATRKLGVSPRIARQKIELTAMMNVVHLGTADILAAIDLHLAHSISYWDALIVQSALRGGASVLYSEDMQSGRHWNDVRVVNPFSL